MKKSVALVSTTGQPLEFSLVSSKKATKCDHDHIMDLANQISQADSHIKASTTQKLKQIHKQIQFLQHQAVNCLEEAKRDKELHTAACNIKKRPGHKYYFYEKVTKAGVEEKYLSIMSPKEWGSACPHKYLGGNMLGYDMKFTPLEDLEKHEEEDKMIMSIYDKFTSNTTNRITMGDFGNIGIE